MSTAEEILSRFDLKYEDLLEDERRTLEGWLSEIEGGQLTVQMVQEHIEAMRDAVEEKLGEMKDAPDSWFGILSMLIPLYGIVKHWYHSQEELMLKARIRNYKLILAMLTRREKAEVAVERRLTAIAGRKK